MKRIVKKVSKRMIIIFCCFLCIACSPQEEVAATNPGMESAAGADENALAETDDDDGQNAEEEKHLTEISENTAGADENILLETDKNTESNEEENDIGKESERIDEKAEPYIEAYVNLSDDTEIEGCEWMQYGDEQVLRVKIQYKEQPENAYRHKEDYFLFITPDGNVSNVLEINYEDKYIGSACGFEAHFEDVTFDGEKDLLIFLGHSGNGAADACCAYIYENGEFRYERTFEHISYYKVDIENEVIYGYMRYSATSFADLTYKYVNGEFILTETVETYYGSINGENVVEEEIKTTYEYINGEYAVEEEIKTTYEYEYINGENVLVGETVNQR